MLSHPVGGPTREPSGGVRASVTKRGRPPLTGRDGEIPGDAAANQQTTGRVPEQKTGHHGECLQVATAEPTRADDADPGPGTGPRIRVPAPRTDGMHGMHGSDTARAQVSERAKSDSTSRATAAFLALRERLLRH